MRPICSYKLLYAYFSVLEVCSGVMYALVGLAGIGLRILTSQDSEALTECVDLRVEYDRLCAGNRNEVFFNLGMLY